MPPRCHRVGKFLANVVDQRLYTLFKYINLIFPEPQFKCTVRPAYNGHPMDGPILAVIEVYQSVKVCYERA